MRWSQKGTLANITSRTYIGRWRLRAGFAADQEERHYVIQAHEHIGMGVWVCGSYGMYLHSQTPC